MKKFTKILVVLLLIASTLVTYTSCDMIAGIFGGGKLKFVDYAAETKLDMSSPTNKQEVTVKSYIDGDTTHFYVPTSVVETGVLKARYLAINTPESTGKIEEWGKKAAAFTKETLKKATSIIIESDDNHWNADSTGDRYLVWVWYKTSDDAEYRNLNIEILQQGLAIASNSAQNRYGQICMDAIAQAKAHKLHVHSDENDPDYFYGTAIEVSISELRANIESYNGAKVAFNGVITIKNNNGVYVEAYDEETQMYNGIYVYYGFTLTGQGLQMLQEGNEMRIVGTVSYYETGDSYQVSGLQYRSRKPDDPDNIQIISENNAAAFVETTAETFKSKVNRVANVDGEETLQEFDYAALGIATSISMKNLKVVKVYTTDNDASSSDGAMTLTCEVDGQQIEVRTIVLHHEDGTLVTADYFLDKTIDVKGIIDRFDGNYQIKVFALDDITIK